MTGNQKRAVALAAAVLEGKVRTFDLTDSEWALLLLAADLCERCPPPQPVAGRVLDEFDHRRGYFAAGCSIGPTADCHATAGH